MEFKNNLKKIRRNKKMSQEYIAEQLGITRQAVAKWENGTAYPDIDNLILLSEILCVTIDNLVKNNAECSNFANDIVEINNDEVIDFLLLAARSTYAGTGKEVDNPSRPNSHDLHFEKGEYQYIDSYFGGEKFSGEEVIFKLKVPIWVMNYSGRTLSENFSGDFLKEALLKRPFEKPFRGPNLYQNGNYVYYNTVAGDFTWFQGKEEIFYGNQKVYECFYHGESVV